MLPTRKILCAINEKNAKRSVSVIVNSKEIVNNKVIQGVAAYQYEPECFQTNTFQAHGNYQQDSNVGDFVQFTGKLIYENETLYLTLLNATLLRSKTSESNLLDNTLPLSTPTITITVTMTSPPKKLSNVRLPPLKNQMCTLLVLLCIWLLLGNHLLKIGRFNMRYYEWATTIDA